MTHFKLDLTQPSLFDEWPEEPALVDKVKEYLHTGRTALRNEPRCLSICAAVASGVPYRLVMREFRVGFETIQSVYRVLDGTSKLRTVKEEMRREWEEVLRMTHWRLKEKLVDDAIPSNVLPMLAGIATDKIRDLTGLEEGLNLAKEPGLEVEEILIRMRRVKSKLADPGAAIDVPSIAEVSNSLTINDAVVFPAGAGDPSVAQCGEPAESFSK